MYNDRVYIYTCTQIAGGRAHKLKIRTLPQYMPAGPKLYNLYRNHMPTAYICMGVLLSNYILSSESNIHSV